ncbi:MAG: putative toxin-antitoxin system toxin component, PIN family [Caldilineaceae bacterium]
MNSVQLLRVVLDTNVVFQGLTKQGGVCGTIINAWFHSFIHVCVTDALAYEYVDVLSRKLTAARYQDIATTLATLLSSVDVITIYYRWRPSSPDPGDELVIDCAMNANAILVTENIRDFRDAQRTLGLRVMTPVQFLAVLADKLNIE